MRVIITGGTGFIGSHLASNLVTDGHEVIILSRNPTKHRVQTDPTLQIAEWDAKTGRGWDHLINAETAIVHLASEPLDGNAFFPAPWTAARRRKILDSRIQTASAIVNAVENAAAKPQVLIQQSAVGYYGYDQEAVFTETSPPGTNFAAEVCVAWENATAPVENIGVRRPVIRTGLLLDPKEGVMPRLILPFKLFVGGTMGAGNQWYSWIHIADQIGAIRYLLAEAGMTGPFNLTAPNPVRNKEFAKTLGQVMRRPSLIPVPGPALRIPLGEVADLALKGQRVIPERLLKSGYNFSFPYLEAALRDLLSK